MILDLKWIHKTNSEFIVNSKMVLDSEYCDKVVDLLWLHEADSSFKERLQNRHLIHSELTKLIVDPG